MTPEQNDLPPEIEASQDLVVTQSDWNELIIEWQQAGVAAQEALSRVTWPEVKVQDLDAWLLAVERQTIAKTRLAALGELQLRKK